MKQYLSKEQTSKLIELGFERPRALVDKYYDFDAETYAEVKAYSIGELIEMLNGQCIEIVQITDYWRIGHEDCDKCSDELIDALYDMILTLKEEGVL